MTTDTREALAALIEAAQAIVDRWDTPLWKDVPHTGEYINRLRAALATQPAQPVAGAVASAKPLKWSHAYADQWLDEDYGFSIMVEADSETPYSASWGEGDEEDFATLEEAKAWCQAEIDAWVRGHVVVTPAQPSAQGEAVAWNVMQKLRDEVMDFRHTRDGMVRGGDYVRLDDLLSAAERIDAASAPAAPAQAVPLTPLRDGEIALMTSAVLLTDYDTLTDYDIAVIRAYEQARGIKAAP